MNGPRAVDCRSAIAGGEVDAHPAACEGMEP